MSLQNKLKRLSDDFHNAAAASFSLYFIRWPVGSCRQVDGPPGLRGGPGISTFMNSKLGIFYIQSEDPSVAYADHLGRLVDRGGKCLELLPENVHQRIWGRMASQPPSYDAFGWFAALVELAIHGIDGLSAVPHFWDGITSERPSDYEHFREIVAEQEKIGKMRDWYVKIDDLASACCDAADVLLDWAPVQSDSDSGSDAGKVAKPNRKRPSTEEHDDWEKVYREYEKSNLTGDRKAEKKGDWTRKFQVFYESRRDLEAWKIEIAWGNLEAARKRIARRS